MSLKMLISTKLSHGIFKVCSSYSYTPSLCIQQKICISWWNTMHHKIWLPCSFFLIWIELCKIGTEEQNEWYFFSHKDKKYPTGTRTNRATKAGFWKATGRDKAIYCKHSLIGMRKTLVFYKGRAPNGQKSDWIMHEYRLETNENGTPQASN